MRLAQPFIRLPLDFDAAALTAEVSRLPEGWWRPHPQGTPGNAAVPLVAVHGDPDDDATVGAMRPTPYLAELPYVRQVLAGLGTVIGRSRLMRIDEEAEVTPHVDTNAYWWDRVRVHVPIVTDGSVQFECGGEARHLATGEAWIFDTWRLHRVVNPAARPRIHLVVDTVGSPEFWAMVDAAVGDDPPRARLVPNRLGAEIGVRYEAFNASPVMSQWEVDRKIEDVMAEAGRCGLDISHLGPILDAFRRGWRGAWAAHGDRPEGEADFERLRGVLDRALIGDEGRHRLDNGVDLVEMLRQLVIRPALAPTARRPVGDIGSDSLRPSRSSGARPATPLVRPIIIVSSPRSGSTLLFETLARAPHLFTVGGESHQIIESLPELRPSERGWSSNQLGAEDVSTEVYVHLHRNFLHNLRDRQGQRAPQDGRPVRMLEKTPKNALRIPFMADLFPDATFVYLYRDPRETISSMLDAWRSGRFVTYPDLPDWDGPPWSLLLTPGWRDLIGRSLAEVVVDQWVRTTTQLLDDLEALGPDRWCVASYDRLVDDPTAEIRQLCDHLGLEWDVDLASGLPDSRHTLESPHPDKWRDNAAVLEPVWEPARAVAGRAHDVFADPPRIKPVSPVGTSADTAPAPDQQRRQASARAQRSVHTPAVPDLLRQLGASLLVSTYQSGHVIVVRHDGEGLNTHFRSFPSPMGMALDGNLLALGTKHGVWVHQNQPSVTERLEPQGKHDACFMPRTHHVTGDIRVHDLAFSNDELWIVNTRFSCLSTLDGVHSFAPRWRPGFISALAPEDRCHLNGMALVEGEVRFVSALGTTDTPNGWRADKADGGVIIDVPTGEIVTAGLSMPHSPRWYRGRLWVLESGHGSIITVDPETGDRETVAHLPGFTRGIAFAGKYAFVGLSQVREHLFGGLPLTEHLQERVCGVWVVDIEAGSVVGYLRFEGDVHEIYDLQLTSARFPELVEPGADLTSDSFVLSPGALAQVARTEGHGRSRDPLAD